MPVEVATKSLAEFGSYGPEWKLIGVLLLGIAIGVYMFLRFYRKREEDYSKERNHLTEVISSQHADLLENSNKMLIAFNANTSALTLLTERVSTSNDPHKDRRRA